MAGRQERCRRIPSSYGRAGGEIYPETNILSITHNPVLPNEKKVDPIQQEIESFEKHEDEKMRLINADDLIKAFEALKLMNGQYAESFVNMAGNRSMEIECAENYIDNAKTIDAVPTIGAVMMGAAENKILKCTTILDELQEDESSPNLCVNCS